VINKLLAMDHITTDRRTSARCRRWRARGASGTVPLSALVAAPLGSAAPAHAEPVDLAAQQYAKTTRDGWQLTLQQAITNRRTDV
jgi:hypothetical protein